MNRIVTFDDVVEINRLHTNGNGMLVDANTVMSAVGRPWQTFDGAELYPTLIEKAAALLHGLACTQGFVDGNKRTAWLACVGFLGLNDVSPWSTGDRPRPPRRSGSWTGSHRCVDRTGPRPQPFVDRSSSWSGHPS